MMRKAVSAMVFFLLFFVAGGSTAASELRKENSRFIILHTAADERVAGELERESLGIRERIIADIGVDFSERTEVRICPSIEAFREAQPGGRWVPLWAVGTAYSSENVIVLCSPRAVKGRRVDLLQVFAHEFSHIALGRALDGVRIPVWLNEGLAIYEAGEWTFSRIAVLTRAALTNRLIPLPILARSFPDEPGPAELAYAEGFMFVSFLINKIGQGAFHRMIRDYTRYGDLEGALRRGTGMGLAELEEQWLSYLKLRVSWIPIITSVSTLWFAMALIFLYSYLRKRRQAEQRLKEMVAEEAREGTT
jgi:hypothetical protein